MPQERETLRNLARSELTLNAGTHKAEVLRLLAQNANTGYEPREIAASTTVPSSSVYKVLQRLREDDLVEVIADNYLVNEDHLTEINQLLLINEQFDAAATISDRNTAPDEINPVSPEDLDSPPTDLLDD